MVVFMLLLFSSLNVFAISMFNLDRKKQPMALKGLDKTVKLKSPFHKLSELQGFLEFSKHSLFDRMYLCLWDIDSFLMWSQYIHNM